MSILAFIPNPANDFERRFSCPVLPEAVFNQILLPVAQQIGAGMVCGFGNGIEVGISGVVQLENELLGILEHLKSDIENRERVENRVQQLIVEIKRVFENSSEAIVYIG